MNAVWDFLSFQTFISPWALMLFYYLGALVAPVLMLVFAKWIGRVWRRQVLAQVDGLENVISASRQRLRALADQHLDPALERRIRWVVVLVGLFGFLLMELFWRMLFEYLIAFLQMRDALMQLTGS